MKIIRPMAITDAALVSSNIPENDYPPYNPATSYPLAARVIVVGVGVHLVYESLQASNVGHTPAASPEHWVKVGATNRWRMFDASITTQAENEDSISVSIKATGIANGIALLNIDCAIIRIVATDVEFGVVYDKTINPAMTSGISDIYSYFREPVTRVSEMALTDLPSYSNMTIDVTLSSPGNVVRCGGIVIGQMRLMGDLQYGAKSGIANYTKKTRDQWGNFDVVEGPFSNTATWSIWIKSTEVDLVKRLLSQYRATPIVYIGADSYGALILYGYYKDFSIDIAYPTISICSLELEGLT
ncbi:hypothetical protein [Duganella phyllosphaerae]|uniref:Uncharacterized protein n=1 Tax=Duganella phyllosphaerae TaxID=762836 RepID=A0A1E7W629_9BURK|nr:hypothetical protein [Duganella phyllosphaerae]OEZ91454.1 hypothetical protein DUPY_50660 [Duganella phyllosphaerae]